MAAMGMGQASGRLPDFAKAQLATKSILSLLSLTPKIDNLDESGENEAMRAESSRSPFHDAKLQQSMSLKLNASERLAPSQLRLPSGSNSC